MDRPCYRERVTALASILDELPTAEPDSEAATAPGLDLPDTLASNVRAKLDRGHKLDTLLLKLWNGENDVEHVSELARFVDTNHLCRNDLTSLGTVGEGQFGAVEAVQLSDSDVLALKTIRKDIAWRNRIHVRLPLERHVHLLASLEPSPVPALMAAFQDQEQYYLLTPYAPFGSLWDRMCALSRFSQLGTTSEGNTEKLAPMAEDEVRWWAPQMVDAISWLHLKGYVHRDIKPQNFLIYPDARLQLTDLGSAAPLPSQPATNSGGQTVPLEYCGVPVGTPDYIAPEILRLAEDLLHISLSDSSSRPGLTYDASVDWWSFGVTLYEMMTGQPPFWRPTVAETYQAILAVELGKVVSLVNPAKDLVDLVLTLLRPQHQRLGGIDAMEIRKHSAFSGIDWKDLASRPPPKGMPALQLTELSPPTASMLASTSNSTFGPFDSFSTTSTSEPPPRALPTRPEGYHSTHWSFEPMPSDLVSSGIASPIADSIAAGLITPVRPTPHQIPSTIPKSAARRRPLSERDDMEEMVQCVTASARKRSAPRFTGPVSSGSSFRREEMEVWHQSMSENLSRLDHRLAHLQGLANAEAA